MRKFVAIALAAATVGLAAAPASAGTPHWVNGRGVAHGAGIAQAQGIFHGKGIGITRARDGSLQVRRLNGTYVGKGIVIGRGTIVGRGRAHGFGKVWSPRR